MAKNLLQASEGRLRKGSISVNIMRIWEPQAGAHKNIFFQKIITLVITKLILKIFICLASFISVSCGSS